MQKSERDKLSSGVIGAAIEVHRYLGPGPRESSYEERLCFELGPRGIAHTRQVPLPIVFKGHRLDCGYRMDLVVEARLIVELKSLDQLMRLHEAQLLANLRLSGLQIGLFLNFNVPLLKHELRRHALSPSARSAVDLS